MAVRDLRDLSRVMGIFYILTRVWITYRYAFVKTRRTHISDLCISLCVNFTSKEKKLYTNVEL